MSNDLRDDGSEAERRREQAMRVPPSEAAQTIFRCAWQHIDRRAWNATRTQSALRRTVPSIIARDAPEAYTIHHDDGSTSVIIHEGLVAFVTDMIGALFASARWRGERSALKLDAADDLLCLCYANWKASFDNDQQRPPLVALSDAVSEIADMHRAAALCFIALHEYGHAALHRDRTKEPRAGLEDEADRWGFDALLKLFSYDPTSEFSYVVAGGFLVPRLFSALQRFGVRFPDGYPTPSERSRSLLDQLRSGMQDEISLALATTSAMTLSMRMRAAEMKVTGAPGDTDLAEAEFIAHMTALLLEVGWGKMSRDRLFEIMNRIGFPRAMMAGHIALLDHLYRHDQPTLTNARHPYHAPATDLVMVWPEVRATLIS